MIGLMCLLKWQGRARKSLHDIVEKMFISWEDLDLNAYVKEKVSRAREEFKNWLREMSIQENLVSKRVTRKNKPKKQEVQVVSLVK